jgi:hypothetical protein
MTNDETQRAGFHASFGLVIDSGFWFRASSFIRISGSTSVALGATQHAAHAARTETPYDI